MNKNLRYLQNVNVNGELNNFQVHIFNYPGKFRCATLKLR